MSNSSELELILQTQIEQSELPKPRREYCFHPTRKWRFDFAYPEKLIAIEVEGGTWNGGRHTRGDGFEGDCIKYNEATLLGWRIIRLTSKMIKESERGLDYIRSALKV